jgi:hypothetical protein
MPMCTDSGGQPITFVVNRVEESSSSSTIATENGDGIAGLNECTLMVLAATVALPDTGRGATLMLWQW